MDNAVALSPNATPLVPASFGARVQAMPARSKTSSLIGSPPSPASSSR